ncbi:MAG TPA: acetylglutamate kinase [Actinomycetota bacterium]|nr:acetylglutamate kinase [Actinomycetota bacterium]
MAREDVVAIAELKAGTLVEALPYIRTYRGQTVVVKIGGEALDDPSMAAAVAQDLALMALVGIRLVVVHGGGPQVSDAMTTAGIDPVFVGGLRVTGADAIEIVRRVLVGSINPDLVARLTRAGLAAVGLSGADGALITATPALGPEGQDLGHVGSVSAVEVGIVETLLDAGYTPVVASIASSENGDPMNVNADEVAGAVAAALSAAKLVYLTNVAGLYADFGDAGSLISELKKPELESMAPSLSDGMRPKVMSAVGALDAGVGKVHILDGRVPHALLLEVFTEEGIGTQVLP